MPRAARPSTSTKIPIAASGSIAPTGPFASTASPSAIASTYCITSLTVSCANDGCSVGFGPIHQKNVNNDERLVKCERHVDATESSQRDVLKCACECQPREDRGFEAEEVVREQHREDDARDRINADGKPQVERGDLFGVSREVDRGRRSNETAAACTSARGRFRAGTEASRARPSAARTRPPPLHCRCKRHARQGDTWSARK